MAITLARLEPDDWQRLREARLAALEEAPEAFGSTLAREQEFRESDWRARLEPRHGPKLLASDGNVVAGLVGSFTRADRGATVHLVSMWVSPAYRGTGVAGMLLDTFVAAARLDGRRTVELTVVETNEPARKLYRRHGFVETGETREHPNPAVAREVVMVLQL